MVVKPAPAAEAASGWALNECAEHRARPWAIHDIADEHGFNENGNWSRIQMAKRSLDEFQLGDPLGVGTVGTIYRATDHQSGRGVALKILLPSVSHDALVSARFEREMVILEKLSHPNIVRYYGGGRRDHQLFYAMELVEGGSLKEVLKADGRLSWAEVVACGRQVASALQHAHNHGIIHRDLKPGNLFLDTQGHVTLGDFGIARDTHESDITSDGLTVGTHAYMAPEQITAQTVSGKTDLYSLGCVLYEMLAGHPPFQGSNFAQLFEQHLHAPPPPLRSAGIECPAELESLVMALLQKNPDDRPFSARAVQGSLMQLMSHDSDISESANDVLAAAVADEPSRLLGRRVQSIADVPVNVSRDVSWGSIVCLFALVAGLILIAWFFQA